MYSVPMALADFIPVLLFGAAAVLLQRDLYSKMVKGAYALFAAGTIKPAAGRCISERRRRRGRKPLLWQRCRYIKGRLFLSA